MSESKRGQCKIGDYLVKNMKKGFSVTYPDGTKINMTRNVNSIKLRHNRSVNVTDIAYPVNGFCVSTNEHRHDVHWRVNLVSKGGLIETFAFDRRSEARNFRSEVACSLGVK